MDIALGDLHMIYDAFLSLTNKGRSLEHFVQIALYCVSKKLWHLVSLPQLHKTRCILSKDSVFLCFIDKTDPTHLGKWFSLCKNSHRENQLVYACLLNHYIASPSPRSSLLVQRFSSSPDQTVQPCGSLISKPTIFIEDRVWSCINQT